MGFSFNLDQETKHTITLACDPGHEDGSPLTQWVVKPLTRAMKNDAAKAAGPTPHGGKILASHLADGRIKHNELTPAEFALIGEANEWTFRWHEECAKAVLIEVVGVSDFNFDCISPATLRSEIISELVVAAAKLADLDPKARTEFAAAFGYSTQTD